MLSRMRAEDLYVQELMRRLAEEYPGDIGIMMPLLLNYMRMGKGESFFMAANEPHAYLRGDIMEVRLTCDMWRVRSPLVEITDWRSACTCLMNREVFFLLYQ